MVIPELHRGAAGPCPLSGGRPVRTLLNRVGRNAPDLAFRFTPIAELDLNLEVGSSQ